MSQKAHFNFTTWTALFSNKLVYLSFFLLSFWSPCLTGVSVQLCAQTFPGNCTFNFHVQIPECAISNCRLIYLIDMHNLGNSECKIGTQLWQSDIDVWLQNYRVRAPQKLCEEAQSVQLGRCLWSSRNVWKSWSEENEDTNPHVQISQDEVLQNLNEKKPRMVFNVPHILCVMGQLHRTIKSHHCCIWLWRHWTSG